MATITVYNYKRDGVHCYYYDKEAILLVQEVINAGGHRIPTDPRE